MFFRNLGFFKPPLYKYASIKLLNLKDYIHKNLANFDVLGSSYIVPIVFGENEKALNVSKLLYDNGFYSLAIRYPTVAKNSARLRISLNSSIEQADLDPLFEVLSRIK